MRVIVTNEERREFRRFVRRTKEKIKNTVIVLILILLVIVAGYIECNYSIEAKITDLDGYTYTAVDVEGYTWKFEDDVLFPVGTKVKLRIHDNITHSRLDDEVWGVKRIK